MLKRSAFTLLMLLASSLLKAATHQVEMVNRNTYGAMAFEPSYIKIAPGDTVKFIKTAAGHNAATINDMIPIGAKTYLGNINEEIEMTFDKVGFYGIECTPHYAMGMVMLIQVGDGDISDFKVPSSVPKRALQRFEAIKASANPSE